MAFIVTIPKPRGWAGRDIYFLPRDLDLVDGDPGALATRPPGTDARNRDAVARPGTSPSRINSIRIASARDGVPYEANSNRARDGSEHLRSDLPSRLLPPVRCLGQHDRNSMDHLQFLGVRSSAAFLLHKQRSLYVADQIFRRAAR